MMEMLFLELGLQLLELLTHISQLTLLVELIGSLTLLQFNHSKLSFMDLDLMMVMDMLEDLD